MTKNIELNPTRLNRNNGDVEQFDEDETAVINNLLTNSQNKYQGLFEATPVSLWEEDFSEVKKVIEQLREDGVTDFLSYFSAHPEIVSHCISLVRVIDVNQATLKMYNAKSKQELLDNLDKIFGTEAFEIFKQELIVISQGGTVFESEGVNYTLDGDAKDVAIRWSVSPGYEKSLSQIIVSSIDITEAKRASKQLKLQAAALESAANAIVISDDKGDILWVNPAFTKLTGYSYNEVLGRNSRILKSGNNNEKIYQDLWSTIRAGNVWHGEELINCRKDGTLYHEQMTIAPVEDENGKISRFVAIKENITERKQLEMKLRRQLKEEEVLRQIVSLTTSKNEFSEIVATICETLTHFFNMPICAFALLNEESMYMDVIADYVNSTAVDSEHNLISILNVAPKDFLMAQKTALIITDVNNADILEPVQDILQESDNASAFLIPVDIDEQIKGVFEFATQNSQEFTQADISFVEQIATQISQAFQRIRAEEELETQRDFARQIMNNMGQGLVVANTNWFIEYSNPTFARMLGYHPEELVGKSVLDLVFRLNKKKVDKVYRRWLDGDVQKIELPLVHVNGSTLYVLMTAVPRYVDGEISGAIAVIADLTERKQMETRLRRNLQEEELLRRVASLTTSKNDFMDTLTSACVELSQFFQVPKGAFALINEERTHAEVIAEYCEPGQRSSLGHPIPLANNASMEFLLNEKKALAITDAQHDPLMAPVHAMMAEFGIASILLIPILIDDKVVGTMGFDSLEMREFSDEDIALSQRVANQLGLVLERQQAETALQRERDFAHQIMGNMGQGLLVLTKDQKIRYCNPAFGNILGYNNDELIDKSMVSLLSNADIYESIQPASKDLQANKLVRELALRHITGKDVHVLLTAVPRQNNINEGGAIVVVTDLSKQKKIEQALSDARDQAIE
ncbi:MAG: PAS domain S-box protein, partial [Chloroflexi bacterium]